MARRGPVDSSTRMRATAAPEEGNRVRLSVELDETEVDEALDQVMRRLSREVRVPGFRPGRCPAGSSKPAWAVPRRCGSEALATPFPTSTLAVVDTEVDPIAPPEIDITSGEEAGAVTFDALVEVRPDVSASPATSGLVVTLPALDVPDDEIDAQIDRLREPVGRARRGPRPARDGDHVTIDLHGTSADGRRRCRRRRPDVEDYLYEVGSGGVVPGLDEQLRGASVGDILQFERTTEASTGRRRSGCW